jgi:hypothetical protein
MANKQKESCICIEGFSCGGDCGLPFDLCYFSHFEHTCGCNFNGAEVKDGNKYYPTCTNCGTSKASHDRKF